MHIKGEEVYGDVAHHRVLFTTVKCWQSHITHLITLGMLLVIITQRTVISSKEKGQETAEQGAHSSLLIGHGIEALTSSFSLLDMVLSCKACRCVL